MDSARSIVKILGTLFTLQALLMVVCLVLAYHDDAEVFSGFLYTSIGVGATGIAMYFAGPKYPKRITKRDGYLIVTLAWLGMSLVFALPYFACLEITWVNALFESVSGLTTTGATIFNDIESLPNSILLWRSLSQWIGGMGIIVLTVALLPLLGIGGVELFTAEAPGPTSDKIHPRIREVAKRLWLIYVGLTGLLFLILWILPMDLFDAINHAFTTMATGGFSTKNASIAHYGDAGIEYVITIFMLLAGVNYTILYFLLSGRFNRLKENDELKLYLTVLAGFTLMVGGYLFLSMDMSMEESFRLAIFQVTSIVTTTGFATADYTIWGAGVTMIFFVLLFMGASAGSTSGGIKMIRHLVFIRNTYLEFKRLLHPKAMIRIKINKEVVSPRILTHILVFLLIYIIFFFVGTITFAFTGADLTTALGIAATSLGNVGPGIGDVGPANNFSSLNEVQKSVSLFLMLLGRLELFSILILFTPYFWKK
jgi:trk system potassium uptake protein TrkH